MAPVRGSSPLRKRSDGPSYRSVLFDLAADARTLTFEVTSRLAALSAACACAPASASGTVPPSPVEN